MSSILKHIRHKTIAIIWLMHILHFSMAAEMKSVQLVYDPEAARQPSSVTRYVSISGCYFICNAKCILQEETTDNFCMMLAAVLQNKDGNFREGHFDTEVSTFNSWTRKHAY